MATACVLLADGFEEIEAITIIDVLRRAEVRVTTVGTTGPQPEGAHGVRVTADTTLDEAQGPFDAVVLPGGMPGATNLRDDARVRSLLQQQHAQGRIVAAICAAPMALGAAGLLQGRRATCYPGFEAELTGAELSPGAVVEDGPIVTSRGPGTALAFALALAARLTDAQTADGVRAGMLAAG